MPMAIEAGLTIAPRNRGRGDGSGPSRTRKSIFVNSTAESSDDTASGTIDRRRFRRPRNLLVTVHVLISLSLLTYERATYYETRERRRVSHRIAFFVLRAGIIPTSLVDRNKGNLCPANLLGRDVTLASDSPRAYSRSFSKIDGRPSV